MRNRLARRGTDARAIYCSINKKYMRFAVLFLKSLREHYPEHPPVILLHVDLTQDDILQLAEFPGVSVREIRLEDFSNFSLPDSIRGSIHSYRDVDPRTIFARFLLWKPDLDNFDKVLFLDVDIIVVGKLDAMFAGEVPVFTRETYEDGRVNFSDHQAADLVSLLKEDQIELGPSANAGSFMLPRRVRTDENFDLLMRLATRYEAHLAFGDQSVLNLWLWKHGIRFQADYRWNFQIRLIDRIRSRELLRPDCNAFGLGQAGIVHFNGMRDEARWPKMMCLYRMSRVGHGLWMFALANRVRAVSARIARSMACRLGWASHGGSPTPHSCRPCAAPDPPMQARASPASVDTQDRQLIDTSKPTITD